MEGKFTGTLRLQEVFFNGISDCKKWRTTIVPSEKIKNDFCKNNPLISDFDLPLAVENGTQNPLYARGEPASTGSIRSTREY